MSDALWRLEDADGIRLLRCAAIEEIPGVAHAFGTRVAFLGPQFDPDKTGDATPDAGARRRSFLVAAGLGTLEPFTLRQIHGAVILDAVPCSGPHPEADGAFRTARSHPRTGVPVVSTADCVPLLLLDRSAAAVAALHAGWRGVAGGIAAKAVDRFAAEGIPAADLVVAMGPAIAGCCYQVGDDVVRALDAACGGGATYVRRRPDGRTTVDLREALRAQLARAGVPSPSTHVAPFCTRCRNDLFFSVRGEGPATGRQLSVIGPASGP